jgi:glycosyltransferase involved in cell wall biosynthesis
MRVGIDAANLRRGGGVTHLRELLRAGDPRPFGIDHVTVWGGEATLRTLPHGEEWLTLEHVARADGSLPQRTWWANVELERRARAACDLLFVPGGSYAGGFRPFVTMSRNMLPFEPRERARFGLSMMRAKLHALHLVQSRTMRRADGLIFLNEYARNAVMADLRSVRGDTAIIPHGVDDRFRAKPRPQRAVEEFSAADPFRLLYVSIVDVYKHQWSVARAVASLRREHNLPVVIEFLGPSYGPALARFEAARRELDPRGEFLLYRGPAKYDELAAAYHAADAFVFASSCENMPNILLEAMAAGLPIASSNRGPMPEILKDAGVYFDPEQPLEIASALHMLLRDVQRRSQWANAAYERALTYSWRRCAAETWQFLRHAGEGKR